MDVSNIEESISPFPDTAKQLVGLGNILLEVGLSSVITNALFRALQDQRQNIELDRSTKCD